MNVPPCQCEAPGSCELYGGKRISPLQWEICQRRREGMSAETCDYFRGVWYAQAHPELFEPQHGLSAAEVQQLAQSLDDPTLIGNRLAALTKAIGFPPCGGCSQRQRWMNQAHAWLRGKLQHQPLAPALEFVTTEQLTRDALALAAQLPSDLAGVIGVARSGVLPATQIALHLHLPLWILRQSEGDIVPAGHGWRLSDARVKSGKLAVIDDTSMTGYSFRHAQRIVSTAKLPHVLYGVVYRNPKTTGRYDVWARDLPDPHFLEWNLFNSVHLPKTAFDFDGVLTFDGSTNPQYLPRKGSIPLIVTGRSERHRAASHAWLAHWGVRVDRLVMFPGLTPSDPLAIARYKAEHFAASKLAYFVESCPVQAEHIAGLAKKPVICPAAARVFT